MRNKQFIAQHRGGLLSKTQQQQLMQWSCDCAEHVLPLFGDNIDERLSHALAVGRAWQQSQVPTGAAMKASVAAHAAARAATQPTAIAVARAIGHAVATAHMADHALGGAIYALKAVKYAGQSIEAERQWQNERLPAALKAMVMVARQQKEQAFKDLSSNNTLAKF